MGTDSHMFQNIAVRDVRHNTDHYLVLGCLCRAKPVMHLRYLGEHTRFPIMPPDTSDKADRIFSELRGETPKPPR